MKPDFAGFLRRLSFPMLRQWRGLATAMPYAVMALVVAGTITADLPGFRLRESGGCVVGGVQQAVGGVSVNAQGVLNNARQDDTNRLREAMIQSLVSLGGQQADLVQPTELRKVSLRALQEALQAKLDANQPIPDEMAFLAGLQNIRYVFAYPELNDVVLAGFGEGWQLDQHGFVVGKTTRRPVLLLEDLLVALRVTQQSRGAGISCSIDPTADGLQRLQSFVKTLTTAPDNRAALESAVEEHLGPQTISISGVPSTSHYARVLVAADYRMKRIAMAFDPSPVPGLPSYMSMLSGGGRGLNNLLPRWWMTTDYAPLLHDENKLAWELSGAGVKTMSEEDHLQADGTVRRGAQRGGLTQRWAEMMTAKYGDLSVKDPIFGQLRGVMDLTVAAALIVNEGLDKRAGLDLQTLTKKTPVDEYPAPTRTPSIAKSVNKGTSVVISASGGVDIQPFAVVSQQSRSDKLAPVRLQAAPTDARWWWN